MKGKKSFAPLIGIISILIGALIGAAILNSVAPCSNFGFAYVGTLLLLAAIAFGVTGNLAFGGISGVAFAVFLLLSLLPCLKF